MLKSIKDIFDLGKENGSDKYDAYVYYPDDSEIVLVSEDSKLNGLKYLASLPQLKSGITTSDGNHVEKSNPIHKQIRRRQMDGLRIDAETGTTVTIRVYIAK